MPGQYRRRQSRRSQQQGRAAEEVTRLRASPSTRWATAREPKQKGLHHKDVWNEDEEIELHAPAVAADDPAQAADVRCGEQADNHHTFGIRENQPEERDQNEKAELRNAYPDKRERGGGRHEGREKKQAPRHQGATGHPRPGPHSIPNCLTSVTSQTGSSRTSSVCAMTPLNSGHT